MSAFGIDVNVQCVRIFDGAAKKEAIDQLVDAVATTGAVTDTEALRMALHAREGQVSTGIGGGVAIPHVRIEAVKTPVLAVGLSRSGIDFGSSDGAPVQVVVLFAMPPDTNKLYLGLLAQVMVALKVPNFYERLISCATPGEVVGILNESGA
jgi:PTS system fructose-specific IIC component